MECEIKNLNRRQFLMYSGTAAVAASTISVSLFPGELCRRMGNFTQTRLFYRFLSKKQGWEKFLENSHFFVCIANKFAI